jgi:hypothetical protein
MIKRYFLTIIAFLLLLLGYAVTLTPLVVIGTGLEQQTHLLAFGIWGVLVFGSLIPFLSMIIRKIWFFRGHGEPVALKMLQEKLLAVNHGKGPVLVQEKKKKFIVTWHYANPQWCELMNRIGMDRLYELHLFFDNATKTVVFSDKNRSLRFVACPEKVRTGFIAKPKLFLKVSLGEQWSVDNYTGAEPQDYSFLPGEIKSPVLGTVLKCGWNVRFSFF